MINAGRTQAAASPFPGLYCTLTLADAAGVLMDTPPPPSDMPAPLETTPDPLAALPWVLAPSLEPGATAGMSPASIVGDVAPVPAAPPALRFRGVGQGRPALLGAVIDKAPVGRAVAPQHSDWRPRREGRSGGFVETSSPGRGQRARLSTCSSTVYRCPRQCAADAENEHGGHRRGSRCEERNHVATGILELDSGRPRNSSFTATR